MIVVAGHVCLDLTPRLEHAIDWRPGSLYEVGPLTLSVGGAVGNVGSVLSALGVPVRRVGAIGDDPFGAVVRELLGEGPNDDPQRPQRTVLTRLPDRATSYTLVVSDPVNDRIFLHHPGVNDAFGGDDLRAGLAELEQREPGLLGSAFLHVGYPPVMAATYCDGGRTFAAALGWAREQGATISLDMAMPDPAGPAAGVDWNVFLQRVLPTVHLFAPSWTDLTALVPGLPDAADRDALAHTTASFLAMGSTAVLLKLGRRGAYLRTSPDHPNGRAWRGRELLSPNLIVDAINATGAGDATIAGFLAALRAGATPEHALNVASATGAASVTGLDAASGVPTLASLEARLARGWQRTPATWFGADDVDASGIVHGPADTRREGP